jgi:hypothetical protein
LPKGDGKEKDTYVCKSNQRLMCRAGFCVV